MITRERHKSIQRFEGGRESLPRTGVLAELGSFGRVTLALSLGLALLAPEAAAAEVAALVTITQPHEEGQLLRTVFHSVTNRGVSMNFAAGVIRSLNEYLDARTASGKKATVCIALYTDLIMATHSARWSIADASRLVVQIQGELDAEPRAALERSQRVITMIQKGNAADDIILGRVRQASR